MAEPPNGRCQRKLAAAARNLLAGRMRNPSRQFNSSSEVIRLVVTMCASQRMYDMGCKRTFADPDSQSPERVRHDSEIALAELTDDKNSEKATTAGLVPRRYQSGEIDYVGGISKVGDRRVRTLLHEAADVILTRYRSELKLKDWALAIARRTTMRKARIALARRLAIIMHAMLRDGTRFQPA